ncbi:MAG: ribosome biogenesis GTPase YlqF [Oscillospiraceae bacterium]|jgi:ribosome biogenesis GTPase A|nr:ribosome biogenesis GTPase YlqF [Oscillospiraceae bacterium]
MKRKPERGGRNTAATDGRNTAIPEGGRNTAAAPPLQWFPGHMAKTRRLMQEHLSLVDGVVELRDARAPESSANPELPKWTGEKPRILLLNKRDLAEADATRAWAQRLRAQGAHVLICDCKTGKGLQDFLPTVKKALAPVIEKNASKGMPGKPLRLMVVGIPNTGKSSFINRMAKQSKAAAADRPGVTRRLTWFSLGKINGIPLELLDTPGVLWPKLEDQAAAQRLAFLGSIRDEVMDTEHLACLLLRFLQEGYTDRLRERYTLTDTGGEPYNLLAAIGKGRGMLLPGGETDTLRAANALLDDFRGGKLGSITLERA